jgi:hypothetical protein
MTAKQVLEQWTPPRGASPLVDLGELSDDPKMAWKEFASWTRWLQLHDKMKVRRVTLRTVNRRWRRQNGLSLKGA